jgi:hypothetical protein
LTVIVPVSLLGQTPAAVLHTQGGVWVNGYEARDSSAIFEGDLLETKPESSANLTLEGTSILIQPESVAKFQKDILILDHGSVAVETSRSFKVRVHCITVVPVLNEWTHYEVADVNGTVQVAARKLDVKVEQDIWERKPSPDTEASRGGVVHESEQKSYNESEVCGAPAQPTSPTSILNTKWVIGGAAGGVGLLLCLTVFCKGHTQPVSPAVP